MDEDLKSLNDDLTECFYSPSVLFTFRQEHFFQFCPEKFIQFLKQLHTKSAQKRPAKHEKTSRGKISKLVLVVFSEKNNFDAKKRCSAFLKAVTAREILFYFLSLNTCLYMQQFDLVPPSVYKKSLQTQKDKKQKPSK